MITKALVTNSKITTNIGDHPVHPGDRLEFTWRGDGLWNVTLNHVRIDHSVDSYFINQISDELLVKESI